MVRKVDETTTWESLGLSDEARKRLDFLSVQDLILAVRYDRLELERRPNCIHCLPKPFCRKVQAAVEEAGFIFEENPKSRNLRDFFAAVRRISVEEMEIRNLARDLGMDEKDVNAHMAYERRFQYEDQHIAEVHSVLAEAFSERDCSIIMRRFGLIDGQKSTLEKIAYEHGLHSHERARQIINGMPGRMYKPYYFQALCWIQNNKSLAEYRELHQEEMQRLEAKQCNQLKELGFSTRLVNCLNSLNIRTTDALATTSWRELRRTRNFGVACEKELRGWLDWLGIEIRD